MEKQTITIIALAVLLILSLGYIGMIKYTSYTHKKDLGIYQQGAQYGYEQAIIKIAQRSVTCQQVPLRIENKTINMIAVDCLKQK